MTKVAFVLHRPRSPDNVGAVARVVKNFGLARLRLVDPLSHRFDRAEKLAVGAEDVLRELYVDRDLPSALAEFTLAIGTSSRAIRGRASLHPAEVAEVVKHSQGPVAVVFGDEKRGLSDEELRACQFVCRIPSDAAQPSLNLAQACAVMAYALSDAMPAMPEQPVATLRDLRALRERLRAVLSPSDFLNPQAPDRGLDEVLAPLARAELTQRELELWQNALRKVALALGRVSTPSEQ